MVVEEEVKEWKVKVKKVKKNMIVILKKEDMMDLNQERE